MGYYNNHTEKVPLIAICNVHRSIDDMNCMTRLPSHNKDCETQHNNFNEVICDYFEKRQRFCWVSSLVDYDSILTYLRVYV